MTQYKLDLIKVIVITVIIVAVGFSSGFVIGRNRPPTIKTILLEDKADREYLERYHKAGGGYDYVLHKEYKMDAEFMIDE